MPSEPPPDISVVICTRNRAESLRQTLRYLAEAERGPLRVEVVIVDNGGNDHTAEVAAEFRRHFPVHLLREPVAGKGQALNRALADAPLGDVVVVLDDDMSPEREWFQGVWAICQRHPEADFFTGRTYVVWPRPQIPEWCRRLWLQSWAFSVSGDTKQDRPAGAGRWFSGNHFWFRSRVLAGGRRFDTGELYLRSHIGMEEARFQLQLGEEGLRGVMGRDAACGHRIQEDLLEFDKLRERAARVGRGFAHARLEPYRSRVKQARLFRKHPIEGRLF